MTYSCRCGRAPCTLVVKPVRFRRVRRVGFSTLRFVHVDWSAR